MVQHNLFVEQEQVDVKSYTVILLVLHICESLLSSSMKYLFNDVVRGVLK